MKIKTFYGNSMAEVLQQIKATLGDDALLLSTREIANQSGYGGTSFEVVAAVDTGEDYGGYRDETGSGKRSDVDSASFSPKARAAFSAVRRESRSVQSVPDGRTPRQPETRPRPENSAGAGHEIAERFRQVPAASRTLAGIAVPDVSKPTVSDAPQASGKSSLGQRHAAAARPAAPAAAAKTGQAASGTGELSDEMFLVIFKDLVSSGVDEWLARKLLTDARDELNTGRGKTRSELLRAAGVAAGGLLSRPSSPDGTPRKKVVAFVGPTGVGKTTAMVKLAAQLALRQKKKVIVMTLDGYRIGAIEQLKSYAGLLGIPFRFVSQVRDLAKAVAEQGQRDYVLIDTAGRSPRDLGAMREISDYLQSSEEVEKHLVLSATTKQSDMRDIVERFDVCRPDYLLFTKLDETWTLGPILNELVRSQKPMSYYSDGQRVPEDLHIAPPEQIVDIVLSGRYLW
jgi:flagellar biosynthesis protein FlhF